MFVRQFLLTNTAVQRKATEAEMNTPAVENEKRIAEIDGLIKRPPADSRYFLGVRENFIYSGSISCFSPWGVDVDASVILYASDYGGSALVEYVGDGGTGGGRLGGAIVGGPWWLRLSSGIGDQPGQVLYPKGVAAD